MEHPKIYATYMLEYKTPTKKGVKYYIGQSGNVARRIMEHIDGRGAQATKRLGVKRIVDIRYFATRGEAMREERRAWERVRRK